MASERFSFDYEVYSSAEALAQYDRQLLEAAQQATGLAYAPYSQFRVGAAAELANGEVITGSNQENASFPAGICAEGTVMAIASSLFPGIPIRNLAISYNADKVESDHPIAPCGICRQKLAEFHMRTGGVIRLILGGRNGKVIIVSDASHLMPFSFKF